MTPATSLGMVGAAFGFAFFGEAMTDLAVWLHCYDRGGCPDDASIDRDIKFAGFGVGAMLTIFFAAWAAHASLRTRQEATALILAIVASGFWVILKIGVGPGHYPEVSTLFAPLGIYAALSGVLLQPLLILGQDSLLVVAEMTVSILFALLLSVIVFEGLLGRDTTSTYILKPYAVVGVSTPWAILIAALWTAGGRGTVPRKSVLLAGLTAFVIAVGYGLTKEFEAEVQGRSLIMGPLLSLALFGPAITAVVMARRLRHWSRQVAVVVLSPIASALLLLLMSWKLDLSQPVVIAATHAVVLLVSIVTACLACRVTEFGFSGVGR